MKGRTSNPEHREILVVVAAAENGVIGHEGAMPWRVPSDLKTFRRLTIGCPVVMGRRTFEAIGRALPGRTNIVVTRDTAFRADNVVVADSIEKALAAAHAAPAVRPQICVIGGGEIYRTMLPIADVIYLTRIHAEPAGDTWFETPGAATWALVSQEPIPPEPDDQFTATLCTFRRRKDVP